MSRDEFNALVAKLDALTQSLADRLPPEPLYSFEQASLLLYVSLTYLRELTYTHRAALTPPRYRWDRRHCRHRMLTASDLATLRTKLVRRSKRVPVHAQVA